MQNHVRGLLADHDAGRVCVARGQRGHDGRVGDPQADDAVHAQLVIDHGPGVARGPHLAGAHVVVDSVRVVADDALPVRVGKRLVVFAKRIRIAKEL